MAHEQAGAGVTGRCKTCKHWWRWDSEAEPGAGYCQRITADPGPVILAYCNGGALITFREFGCVQWEATD